MPSTFVGPFSKSHGDESHDWQVEKPTLAQYPEWHRDVLNLELTDKTETHYRSATGHLVAKLEASEYWGKLSTAIKTCDERYLINTHYRLLATDQQLPVRLVIKPYKTLVLKCFRRNILENQEYPGPPKIKLDHGALQTVDLETTEWFSSDNWFLKIHDVVRSLIVVKYLDAVELLAAVLKSVADEFGYRCEISAEARDEGYYAYHVVTWVPCELLGTTWVVTTEEIPVELQISTQVQDVIRGLTHKYYEKRRGSADPPREKWQWAFDSDEFIPNYLGHILHYMEGMIMEVRNREGNSE